MTEHCVCCGRYIPEGSLVCSRCASIEGKSQVRFIAGVPIEDAIAVLTLYRNGIPCPNKDYFSGFKAGYARCMEDQQGVINKLVKEQIDGTRSEIVPTLWKAPKN